MLRVKFHHHFIHFRSSRIRKPFAPKFFTEPGTDLWFAELLVPQNTSINLPIEENGLHQDTENGWLNGHVQSFYQPYN